MTDRWSIVGVIGDIVVGALLLGVSYRALQASDRLTKLEQQSRRRTLLSMGISPMFLDQDVPWYGVQVANPTTNPVVVSGVNLQISDGLHTTIRSPLGTPMHVESLPNGLGIISVGEHWVRKVENVEIPAGHVATIYLRLRSFVVRGSTLRFTVELRGPGLEPLTFTNYVMAHQAVRIEKHGLTDHFEKEAKWHTYRQMTAEQRDALRQHAVDFPSEDDLFPGRSKRKWWYSFFRM